MTEKVTLRQALEDAKRQILADNEKAAERKAIAAGLGVGEWESCMPAAYYTVCDALAADEERSIVPKIFAGLLRSAQDDLNKSPSCVTTRMASESITRAIELLNGDFPAVAVNAELLEALAEIVSQIDQGGNNGKVFARDYCITAARTAIANAGKLMGETA